MVITHAKGKSIHIYHDGNVGLRSEGRKLRPESVSKRDIKKQNLTRKLELENDRNESQGPSKGVMGYN